MIKDVQELNFPSYATMSAATVSLPDMGEWNITSQIKIDGQIAPDFSFDWEVVHDGHKYIMPLRIPAGSKDNQKPPSVIDLTFQHWAIWQLKRWYFFNLPSTEAGVAWKKYIAPVSLNLGDFCSLFGTILNYYYGDKITLDLNPQWEYKSEPETISISYTKLWSVITEVFYKQFGVRWKIEPNGSPDKYVIKVGYPTTEQSHIFEYGFEGGLMKAERQVQSEEIYNMLLGCGGEKNLPYRYFKNVAPENPSFKADPDWIEELADTYFSNLMPATFRSYVQGWKAAHLDATDSEGNLLYEGYEPVGEANAYAPWAYRKGFTDTKFDPVEYVADEITINPEAGDKQVAISPTYSPYVKKNSSIAKYGPLLEGLDNNEDIYPTIQGVTVDPYGRIDEAVEVEPITSDDIEEAAENDAQVSNVGGCRGTISKVAASAYKTFTIQGATFNVANGKSANLEVSPIILSVTTGDRYEKVDASVSAEITNYSIKVYGSSGLMSASGLTGGSYRYEVEVTVHNMTTDKTLNITVGAESPILTSATISDKWKGTWRIWVKNIWQTSKQSGETDAQYAERVWRPIFGDREGNEAKVVFASGALAHEDYEFTIVTTPKYERKLCKWQTVENGEIVEHEYWSEWCIELGKSDADLDALGVYLPSVMRQAIAGDFFFFIGIDMPHLYVKWGEERVDDWKKDNLQDKKDIKPTWVVQTDRVRLNNEGKEDALIRQLHPGDTLRLADKRFIEGDYETLYLSSLTITYREPTKDDAALNPDVEIVLSDRYEVSANPVATLQGEVEALTKQVGSISNVEQIVRAVGDKLYLRKDGLPDRSLSPTEFASLLTSMGFRSGIVGGAGWGVYKDSNGNWVIEADRLLARQDLEVNNLVINQVVGQGGTTVESAARMEITKVVERTNGYACYFDQKGGSVANLFHVDDVAWNNRYTAEDEDISFYRRRVIEVGLDYVVLSKTDVNGTGIPAEGDVIVQRGNYTDANRQFIKVRDVIGGGYERYIEGLDSVNAEGVQYYCVGRQAGVHNGRPYFFLGDENGFIEWVNGVLNIKGKIVATSTIGDKTIEQYIKDVVPPVTQEDIEGYVNAIVDPQIEGLQNQIDGVIETWFYNGVPTLNNYPASEWNTEALKIQHLGDLYYDNDTGTAYRFSQDADNNYFWNVITDDAITKALAAAQKAQDTADGKRRVFTDTPTAPYEAGDLWVNATYGTQYNNDILRCVTAKANGGTFAIADWELASNYTDDTVAQEAKDEIAGYEYIKKAIANGATITQGSLILSGLIKLGQWDLTDREHPVQTAVWAGMNGIYMHPKTIASWWGGDMVDKFYGTDGVKLATPLTSDYAAALVRMDGSAYFSKGNIGFEADGSGWLGNYENGIKFDSHGGITFGSGINITIGSGDSGLSETLSSLVTAVSDISRMLEWVPDSSLAEGGYIRAKANFASVGEITAMGASGSGGTTPPAPTKVSDLLDVNVAGVANGMVLVYRNGYWVAETPQSGGIDTVQLASYLSQNNYVQQSVLADYVTLNTEQEISGAKTFTSELTKISKQLELRGVNNGTLQQRPNLLFHIPNIAYARFVLGDSGAVHLLKGGATDFNSYESLKVGSIIRNGGTASQFLKADGSVDENSYVKIDGSNGTMAGVNALVKLLGDATADILDTTKLITSDVTGDSGTLLYYRRPVTALWNYIKSKSDAQYVKKSGDTMSGQLNFSAYNHLINAKYNLEGSYSNVLFVDPSTNRVIYGSPNWVKVVLETSASCAYRQTSGVEYQIWDSGNDGSGSGLDADLLDGLHNGDLTANKWNIYGAVADFNATMNRNGIYTWGSNIPNQPNAYGSMLQWSNQNIPTGGTSQHWITQLASSTNNRLYYRTRTNTANWESWSTIAFTSDNVASATKLQTARSLWGNSFNGEGDVNGNITFPNTNGIYGTSTAGVKGHLLSLNSNNDVVINWGFRNSAQLGLFGSYILFSSGDTELGRWTTSGLSIGTTTPVTGAKLHVQGNIYASGEITAGGTSDVRLKRNVMPIHNAIGLLKTLGGYYTFDYLPGAVEREHNGRIGLLYQNVGGHFAELMAFHRPDGYGALNYLKPDYINLIGAATLENAEEIARLKQRVAELEEELERRLRA